MKLAAASYPIDWHDRWNDYVGKIRVWVRTAAEEGADLVVLPEMAALELASLAGEANAAEPERAVEALAARIGDVDALHASLAREFGLHLCAASGPLRAGDGRIFNRARLFAPDGGRGAQDKLAPRQAERAVWGTASGAACRLFETALGRVGILIGSDISEPRLAAAMARAGASVLLAPAFAATPEAATALRDAAAARARETGRLVAQPFALADPAEAPSAGAATGAAIIWGPGGAALAEGEQDAPGWVYAEVEPPAPREAREGADPSDPAVEVTALTADPRP